LSTIAPLRVCDEVAFDDLYGKLVYDAKEEISVLVDGETYIESLEEDVLYDVLNTLHSRLTCLGLTCEHVGSSRLLNENPEIPTCTDPSLDSLGYPHDEPEDEYLRHLKIDMDVRAIGTLVEMDANDAAFDVYRWGRHMRRVGYNSTSELDVNDGAAVEGVEVVVALRDMVNEPWHTNNSAATAYSFDYDQNEDMYQIIMGLYQFDELEGASPAQRRVIVESALIFMTARVHALNRMYEAVDDCREGNAESTWDQAFAAFSGWAGEGQFARGFFLMGVARFLCEQDGSCLDGSSTRIEELFLDGFQGGKEMLRNMGCDDAESVIHDIEKLMLTVLVDAAAYYAKQLSNDVTNADYLARGCESLCPWFCHGVRFGFVSMNIRFPSRCYKLCKSRLVLSCGPIFFTNTFFPQMA
jgi:hypothetical protein